jgi:hypothetical protein
MSTDDISSTAIYPNIGEVPPSSQEITAIPFSWDKM